jgi:hypothetical protein
LLLSARLTIVLERLFSRSWHQNALVQQKDSSVTPKLPRAFTVIPTPGIGEPVIVDGIPGLILDLLGQVDGTWLVRTNRGQDCAIVRPWRHMGDSMAWLARPLDARAA